MANTLTFANQTLTDADVFGGINYIVDLNAGEEFSIGNTASASVSFVTNIQLPLYTKNQTNGTFVWTEDNTTKGRFYITEVTKADNGYEVEAYDAMILLDTSITALSLSLPVTVSAAASAIATYIGCTLSGTLINGTMTADALDDATTIRQLLSWVAEASGCSVKIDGSDHICLMYYAASGITVTASDYKEHGLQVADYTCAAIDNVTICDAAGITTATAGSGTNSLFVIGNPFLDNATNTEAAAILAVVDGFVYAPITCEMFDDNGLEVGVSATFGTVTSLVMHLEQSEEGVTVSSVGSDSRAEFNKDLDIIANEALMTATKTGQYFWHTATDTGAGAGAHITEIPKEDFLNGPANGGGNVLIDSGGLDVRDGLTSLAAFTSSAARVGEESVNHVEVTPSGTDFYSDTTTKLGAIETFNGGLGIIGTGGVYVLGVDGVFVYGGTSANKPVSISGSAVNIGGNITAADNLKVEGRYTELYKVTSFTKTLSGGVGADSYIAAADITIPSASRVSGYNAVGIVGHASNYFRVQPTTNYVKDNTTIYAGFANWSATPVTNDVTITFYILWLKATTA